MGGAGTPTGSVPLQRDAADVAPAAGTPVVEAPTEPAGSIATPSAAVDPTDEAGVTSLGSGDLNRGGYRRRDNCTAGLGGEPKWAAGPEPDPPNLIVEQLGQPSRCFGDPDLSRRLARRRPNSRGSRSRSTGKRRTVIPLIDSTPGRRSLRHVT